MVAPSLDDQIAEALRLASYWAQELNQVNDQLSATVETIQKIRGEDDADDGR